MKNLVKSVCVIIGSIIGAGFASGREIYIFFNMYGIKGLIGIIISTIIIGFIIYEVLINSRSTSISNYEEFLNSLKLNKKVKYVLNSIINIFLLISFYVMISGLYAYFKQEFRICRYL